MSMTSRTNFERMGRIKHKKRANKKPKSKKPRSNQQPSSKMASSLQPSHQLSLAPKVLQGVVRVVDYAPRHSFGNEEVKLDVQRSSKQSNWILPVSKLRSYFPRADGLTSGRGNNLKYYSIDCQTLSISLPSTDKIYQVIYADSNIPIKFSIHDASPSPIVREAIRFANALMTATRFNEAFVQLAPEEPGTFRKKVARLLPCVQIAYMDINRPELKHCWAWTKNTLGESNTQIYLCEYFSRRFDLVRSDTQEWKTMVFFMGICLLHEVGHLFQRWMDEKKTLIIYPNLFEEGGEFIERFLFNGVFSVEAAFENVKTKRIGDDFSLDKDPYIVGLLFKDNRGLPFRIMPSYIEACYERLVVGKEKLLLIPPVQLEPEPYQEGPLLNGDYGVEFKFLDELRPSSVPKTTKIFATRPNTVEWSIAGRPNLLPLAPTLLQLDLPNTQNITDEK